MASPASLEVQHQWRQTGADSKMKRHRCSAEGTKFTSYKLSSHLPGWRDVAGEPRSSQPAVPEAPWSICLLVSVHSGLLPYLCCFVLPFLGGPGKDYFRAEGYQVVPCFSLTCFLSRSRNATESERQAHFAVS